jgi:hypothetical protein
MHCLITTRALDDDAAKELSEKGIIIIDRKAMVTV